VSSSRCSIGYKTIVLRWTVVYAFAGARMLCAVFYTGLFGTTSKSIDLHNFNKINNSKY
jgi:hypothetical protein